MRKDWKHKPWKHRGPWEREEPREEDEAQEWRPPWEWSPPWEWEHHEHWGPPPWERWRHHRSEFGRWHRKWRHKRTPLFFRFVGAFGFIVLLFLGGMAALAYVLTRLFGGTGQITALVWMGGCGLALAMPLLAAAIAFWTFRGVATPIADVMTAADAVADGDLSARVPAPRHGPHAFARLAHSFNRMAAELERADPAVRVRIRECRSERGGAVRRRS